MVAEAGYDLWRRAVAGADAPQSPQHAADVGAEHTAVDVGLVQDHEAQIGEKVGPKRVVGQDARCSMSGLVSRMFASRRNRVRAAWEVSPS